MNKNIILLTDSYKASHWKQYPPGTESVFSYFESRGPVEIPGGWPDVVFFGLQYYIKEYLQGQVVTQEKIDYADELFNAHFGQNQFNRAGWEYILKKHDGRLPVVIKAVAEGTVVPRSNVLMTIENTDPQCFWLTNYLETLLVQVWYGTTVATQSREFKMMIMDYMEKTGSDMSLVDFKLHDFGFRGVSSVETAGVGGAAHLISFKGTDTVAGLIVAKDYYNCEMAGYSIPAAEHSTITSWGREHEREAYANMLAQYPTGLVAVVSDSYNIHHANRHIWGEQLKAQVLGRDGVLVVRPDSGDPRKSVIETLEELGEAFGTTTNSKGFKVLNPKVRMICGDGISYQSVPGIYEEMWKYRWSGDNVAFGSGGALLQKLNRDTLKFAFKCCSIMKNGKEQDVSKSPYDDSHKNSKAGRLKLIQTGDTLKTVREEVEGENLLLEVFRDGELLIDTTLDEIRELAFTE